MNEREGVKEREKESERGRKMRDERREKVRCQKINLMSNFDNKLFLDILSKLLSILTRKTNLSWRGFIFPDFVKSVDFFGTFLKF